MLSTLRAGSSTRSCQGRREGQAFRPGLESLEGRELLSATHLGITLPLTARAGEVVPVTVTALDSASAVAADYRGTVHFGSSDVSATLPADYSFTEADQGSHTFNITLHSQGAPTVLVMDTAEGTIQGTASITLAPAGVDHFSVSVVPSTTAGATVDVTITALDASGNTVTDYAGTVLLGSSDHQAIYVSDYTFQAADQGTRTLPVTFKTTGEQLISVTDAEDSEHDGVAMLQVTPLNVHYFEVEAPASVTAGTVSDVHVTARDAFHNTIRDYQGTVQITSSDPGFKPPQPHTFTIGEEGSFTLPAELFTAGIHSITVRSPEGVSGQAIVNVQPAAATRLALQIPTQPTLGAPTTLVTRIEDLHGNLITDYTGTLQFSSTDTAADLPEAYTFVAADGGTKSFSLTFSAVGDYFLTVGDSSNAALRMNMPVSVRYASANQNYVDHIYQELLNRPVDSTGLSHWSTRLDQGMTRTAMITSIQGSPEFHRRYVASLYPALLGREADEEGLNFFVGEMGRGMTMDHVTATLLSSEEYYQMQGAGMDAGFLASLFGDVLTRHIDPTAESHYGEMLARGVQRSEVVRQVLNSDEAHSLVLGDLFDHFLNRDVDPDTLTYFLQRQRDHSTDWVMNVVLSSEEYFRRIG